MTKKSKFRGPSNIRYTQQLFYEMSRELPIDLRTIEPIYTLHVDHGNLINFGRVYVNDMDPTGYTTANKLLENFDHFQLLLKSKWFREAKEQWDKEIAARMEKEAVDKLRSILRDDDVKTSEQLTAAKALLSKAKDVSNDKGSVRASNRRGRPSKEEVEGALKEEMRLTKEEQDDLARIKLVKKQG